MTWPLALHLTQAIPGDGFDGWQNLWNLWWMREAWLNQHSSAYFTAFLHYPTGVDLRYQTMAPFNGLTFLNIQVAGNLLLAYNTAVLFSFVIGAYGTYLLALYALRWVRAPGSPAHVDSTVLGYSSSYKFRPYLHSAAFLAGLVYAFAPYHFAHLLGHLQLIVLQWIPFYVLYLVRSLDSAEVGRHKWIGDAAKAGLFLILVGLCDWYYAMYCLFFTGLLLVVRFVQRRLTWRALAGIAGAIVMFGLVLSPLLVPMIRGARQAAWSSSSLLRGYEETLTLSADLLAFITPQSFHPVWGDWALQASSSFGATPSEYTVFVGFTVLGLVGIALLTTRNLTSSKRRAFSSPWFWLLAAVTFAVLALGPVLHIGGRTDLAPWGGDMPLPYALLYETVPFIKLSRSVSRFAVMVMLSLAVLSAFGLYGLLGWLRELSETRRHDWIVRIVIPLVAPACMILILFEYLAVPYPTSPPDTPEWYHTLAASTESGSVLNLPANFERPGYLLYQTEHGRPMATGYVTRDDPRVLRERAPVLSHFWWLGTDIHTRQFDLGRQGMQVLHDLLGVRWVVLDRYKMPGGPAREVTEAYAAEIFPANGHKPVYEDERITVYEVVAPTARQPYLILAPGWPPRETDSTGSAYRNLTPGEYGVDLVNPTGEDLALTVEVGSAADTASGPQPPAGSSGAAQNGWGLHLLDDDGNELAELTLQPGTTAPDVLGSKQDGTGSDTLVLQAIIPGTRAESGRLWLELAGSQETEVRVIEISAHPET